MGESPQILNLQTELKYLDLFKSYCIFTDLGPPTPRGVGVGRVGILGLGMMWGPSRQHGDDVGMMGTMGMMWGPQGQHGVETTETTDTTAMGTTWGPSGSYGDDMGMTGMTWGPHGDNKITKNAITFE